MADGVWDGDPLKAGEGRPGYQIAEADYQPFNIEATEDLTVQPDPEWTPVRTTTAGAGETTATVTNEATRAVYRLRVQ